jgi:hypothetical protein
MTTNYGSPRLGIAVCAASLVLTLAGAAVAQSLGEVAREEAARRKAAPAGKVYTNADLPKAEAPHRPERGVGRADGGAAAKTGDTGAADTGATAAKTGHQGRADQEGRSLLAGQDEGGARGESAGRVVRRGAPEPHQRALTDFVNRDDPAQRNAIAGDRQKALDELARVKKEVADHAKAIDDLQTEARREGVPAGWVR